MEGEVYKEHSTRKLIYEYICENPGATFRIIKSAFNMTDGTLRYHLSYLQRRRKVVQEKKGRENSYFSYIRKRFPFSNPNLNLNENQERILELISQHRGISQRTLKRGSGLSRESFEYNMKRLRKQKLIRRVKTRDGFGYEIVTMGKLADEMFLVVVGKYLDGKIEKDEMMALTEQLKEFRKND